MQVIDANWNIAMQKWKVAVKVSALIQCAKMISIQIFHTGFIRHSNSYNK